MISHRPHNKKSRPRLSLFKLFKERLSLMKKASNIMSTRSFLLMSNLTTVGKRSLQRWKGSTSIRNTGLKIRKSAKSTHKIFLKSTKMINRDKPNLRPLSSQSRVLLAKSMNQMRIILIVSMGEETTLQMGVVEILLIPSKLIKPLRMKKSSFSIIRENSQLLRRCAHVFSLTVMPRRIPHH